VDLDQALHPQAAGRLQVHMQCSAHVLVCTPLRTAAGWRLTCDTAASRRDHAACCGCWWGLYLTPSLTCPMHVPS
jgi:hypothetical protein